MHPTTAVNVTEKPTDWNAVNWQQANQSVRNLRQRIFRATQAGDLKKVRSLQKLMLRSYANTLLSVRRVTQINAGKDTPGVDRVTVKTPKARATLVNTLRRDQLWRVHPTRRVYIPKANGKLRPVGIPTILDRCRQARVKNALEPYWEAQFESTSYGFRPGRGAHDAIARIALAVNGRSKLSWVLDADIKGAFDHIAHDALLNAIGAFPGRALIKQWLKAGYIEQEHFYQTDSGTPQGGVISPLLANIALHGMEQALGITYNAKGVRQGQRVVVRYADDFVVLCASREDAQAAHDTLQEWLKIRGLTFSTEKTRVVSMWEGFDFLGFTLQWVRTATRQRGSKLHIRPSRPSLDKLRRRLRQEWFALRGSAIDVLLLRLNPIVRGWANYFRTSSATKAFSKLDSWTFVRAMRHVKHSHSNKSWRWLSARYWGRLNPKRQDKWVFGRTQSGRYLLKFSWFAIQTHVLVKGTASPDDPTLRVYWQHRQATHAPTLPLHQQKLAKRQRYRCSVCAESLFNDESLEVHHVQPRAAGGSHRAENLTLVHFYCHQQLTAQQR